MMGPIITKDDSLARGIEMAGGALGKALEIRANRQYETDRIKQGSTILGGILKKLPENASYNQMMDAYNEAYQAGVPTELITQSSNLYMPMLKAKASSSEMSNLARTMGIGNQSNAQSNTGYKQFENPEYNPSSGFGSQQPQNSPLQMEQPSQAQMNAPFYQQQNPQQQPQKSPISTINTLKQALSNPRPEQPMAPNQHSNEEILALGVFGGDKGVKVADLVLKTRGMEQKKFESDRAYHQKQADVAINNARIIRDTLDKKENSLNLMEQAINTGDTGPVSMANISQHLGIPELMPAAGTQLSQAAKEFFFGNLSRVSAKGQNQWMEQRIANLMANIGDPKINALMKQVVLKSEFELDKNYLKEFDRLSEEDNKKYGYVRNDIEQRAYKNIEKQNSQVLNEASYKTRKLFEQEKGTQWLKEQAASKQKVSKGTYLTEGMANEFYKRSGGDFNKAIMNAKKLGYTIGTQEEMNKWRM